MQMLNGVLQNIDIIPLVLIAISTPYEMHKTVELCSFLTTDSEGWVAAHLNAVPESPYKMAFDLYSWLFGFGVPAPEWFRLKGGLKAYENMLTSG